MQIQHAIESKLQDAFQPEFLEVENESHRHNVPPGSESHFKVTVISEKFSGAKLRERHQMVYSILCDEVSGPVHALSIRAQTPEQWQATGATPHQTPDCRGGDGGQRLGLS